MLGQQVMGEFKGLLTAITQKFVANFQAKRARVVLNPAYTLSVLEQGARKARANANETLSAVHDAMVGNGGKK